jgi:hypothetical protein
MATKPMKPFSPPMAATIQDKFSDYTSAKNSTLAEDNFSNDTKCNQAYSEFGYALNHISKLVRLFFPFIYFVGVNRQHLAINLRGRKHCRENKTAPEGA